MTYGFGKRMKRASIAMAIVSGVVALGTDAVRAQQFDSASITLDKAGNLQCKFRETALTSNSLVTYDCAAEGAGVVTGCFVKNKFVGPFGVAIVQDVMGEQSILAKKNGAINSTITVETPVGNGSVQCDEAAGAEPHTVAVRWCSASLLDVTNNIAGAAISELFALLVRTGDQPPPSVPPCATILAPPTGAGE